MTRILSVALALVIALAGEAGAAPPRVVADIPPVHSLAARVMTGVGEPGLFLPPGASPHDHSMRPREAAALQSADLVVWIGHGLTPWLEGPLETLSGSARRLELLDVPGTRLYERRDEALFEAEGGHGEDRAHDHGDIDPHAWLDPENAKGWLDAIADALSELDAENARTYRQNAARGRAEIDAAVAGAETLLTAARGRTFIVFHDAFQYFERRFALPVAGAIAASDAAAPGPRRLSALRARARDLGAVCVLVEPQVNDRLVDAVFEGLPVRRAVLDPLGSGLAPGPDLYPELIRGLARSIAECG